MKRYRVRAGGFVGAGLVFALLQPAGPAAAQDVLDLPAEDRALPAELEEVFRVGTFDGAEWETFGEVAGVSFDAAAHLYIFDRQTSRIVVLDSSGEFLHAFGQPGEGPGELRMPVGIVTLRDGTVVVADIGHRSYSLFSPEGEFLRMVSMGADGGMIRMGRLTADPAGEPAVYVGGEGMVMSMRAGPGGAPDAPTTRPVERVDLSGDVAEASVVAEGWMPPQEDEPAEMRSGGMTIRMSASGPRTFEPGLFSGPLASGGVAFTDSSTYAIKIADAAGEVQRVLRRPFRPRPVTEAIEEAERERRLEELESGEGPRMQIMTSSGGGGGARAIPQEAIREMMRGRIEQMQFYPELPVLMDLRTGWDGKIWALRRGDQPTEDGALDVLTSEGQYVGTFAKGTVGMPSAFGPDGLVAYVEEGELDVPVVVVRRLPELVR